MNTEQQLQHRIAMIKDDLNKFYEFLEENDLIEKLAKPTKFSESALTHLNNIEVACDLNNDESLSWKLYSK